MHSAAILLHAVCLYDVISMPNSVRAFKLGYMAM